MTTDTTAVRYAGIDIGSRTYGAALLAAEQKKNCS